MSDAGIALEDICVALEAIGYKVENAFSRSYGDGRVEVHFSVIGPVRFAGMKATIVAGPICACPSEELFASGHRGGCPEKKR